MMTRDRYFGISPLLLHPGTAGNFKVYLKRDQDAYLLYCVSNENFSAEKLKRLDQMGVEEIYIPHEDAEEYQSYLRGHLGSILNDKTIPAKARSQVFYDTSCEVVREAFSSRLPSDLPPNFLEHVKKLVSDCMEFLSSETNLGEVARLMSHDYETYTHSVNVFVLTLALMRGQEGYTEDDLKEIGVGTILHDIGKTQIPRNILRKPGKLTGEEFEIVKRHPVIGNAMCMKLELAPKTTNVVLYHHEKMDGSGYPAGIDQESLPGYIRAVTISDIYDALTSKRAYAEAMEPFEALQLIKNEFDGQVDPGIYARLLKILSGCVM